MQGLPRSGNSSAQTSASLHPPAALRLRCLPFTMDMGVHGLCGRVPDSAGNACPPAFVWLPDCVFPSDCCCSDSRKSLGPSAPIAYATYVSPTNKAAAWPWCRYPISDNAAVCLGRCSSKSPSTDAKVNYLVIRYLYFRSVRGGLDLSSSSTSTKVNRLVIRCLHFWSVRGDLQEGHGCSSRCQLPLFPMPIPIISSTKSRFLCAICLRPPPLSGLCEHKNGIFMRF